MTTFGELKLPHLHARVEFFKLEKAANGEWMLQYSVDNGAVDFVWITPFQASLILSAQRVARNELRHTINKALDFERRDGRVPV